GLGTASWDRAYAADSLRRASSAYSAVPSAMTLSSNTASAEWLNGAVDGSAPGGTAPSITNAPGTCSSTYEKSSEPVIGLGDAKNLPSPSTSLTVRSAKLNSAVSFVVTGYPSTNSASADTPCAAAICCIRAGAADLILSRACAENVRTVAM